VQGQQFNPVMQQRQPILNGVAEDVNADKAKPLIQTALVNNVRKVQRPIPMPQNQPPTQAQMMAMKQQQQVLPCSLQY
jgi:hypothetical protein